MIGTVRIPKGHSEGVNAFETIVDKYESVEEVQDALRQAELESSEVILAVDFTASNLDAGKSSFNGHSLHSIETGSNPYISVLSIICKVLRRFDDDEDIPAYGFGDSVSQNTSVFSFAAHDRPIHTLESVLVEYKSLVSRVKLYGPTTFAPAIYKALDIVRKSGGRFHILVILCDGQVSGSGAGSSWETTRNAIIEASAYPLSIVVVGVGDGPFDRMKYLDDHLPERRFDNFQVRLMHPTVWSDVFVLLNLVSLSSRLPPWYRAFVNFTKIAEKAALQKFDEARWMAAFALVALMEVPEQYQTIKRLGLLQNCPSNPPPHVTVHDPPT